MTFAISETFVAADNQPRLFALRDDYDHLGRQLARRSVDIDAITARAMAFRVALPSWGTGTGGTRFGRFPGAGEPRTAFERVEDCAAVNTLVRTTSDVSVHLPWDRVDDPAALRALAEERGLRITTTNSNTFQDQPGQCRSYKFGSLAHTDPAVRAQAIVHNLECLDIGTKLGASSHSVWIADGSNFPGQQHLRHALDRYLDSLGQIYSALPPGWRLFIEHKPYEPAFYSTVLSDWGTSHYCASMLGERALSLVDLGHHAPNVNIEQVVAHLIHVGKLAGFHFNDSKYGDDDLDAGSIKPFQLFLVFNELVDAEQEKVPGFDPCYMLDQSHNVTDPLESLIASTTEVVRAYVQAWLVDRQALAAWQEQNDAVMALSTLKEAFTTDVAPILAMARRRAGGAIDPIATYRASGYRERKAEERGDT